MYEAPLQDFRFALLPALRTILAYAPYRDFSDELMHSILEEAARFAKGQLSPLNRSGDKEGCRLGKDGDVTLPQGFRDAYKAFVAQGWNAAPFSAEVGGQGLPWCVSAALQEIWHGANLSFALMPLLTQSAVHLLMHHGDNWQRSNVLPKLVSGEWSGTMCMTEPQAGSDVGACRTQAVPQPDGTYRIKGNKIFISCGEHDASENIIHMVLARLPAAPEGSRGLSLFMVSKYLLDREGDTGGRNDVRAVSLEHKMGMHASPTAVMAFGDNDGAIGTLVGKPNEGLKTMFTMMNAARLAVGLEGLGVAQYAFQLAAGYAGERVQGRGLASASTGPVAIAQHGDVQRMLMYMESHVSGLRALSIYAGELMDMAAYHPDAAIRESARQRVDLLTPVVKAHTTNMAFEIASTAMQVHGGLGYVEETGVAQLLRDVRVTMIYEGTNGIQALDLVHRKLPLYEKTACAALLNEMRQAVDNTPLGTAFAEALEHLQEATETMLHHVELTSSNTEGKAPSAVAAAPYLTLFGLVLEGWLLLQLLHQPDTDFPSAFLEHKRALTRFYMLDTLAASSTLCKRVRLGSASF